MCKRSIYYIKYKLIFQRPKKKPLVEYFQDDEVTLCLHYYYLSNFHLKAGCSVFQCRL